MCSCKCKGLLSCGVVSVASCNSFGHQRDIRQISDSCDLVVISQTSGCYLVVVRVSSRSHQEGIKQDIRQLAPSYLQTPIALLGSVMGFLYYSYGSHDDNGSSTYHGAWWAIIRQLSRNDMKIGANGAAQLLNYQAVIRWLTGSLQAVKMLWRSQFVTVVTYFTAIETKKLFDFVKNRAAQRYNDSRNIFSQFLL